MTVAGDYVEWPVSSKGFGGNFSGLVDFMGILGSIKNHWHFDYHMGSVSPCYMYTAMIKRVIMTLLSMIANVLQVDTDCVYKLIN